MVCTKSAVGAALMFSLLLCLTSGVEQEYDRAAQRYDDVLSYELFQSGAPDPALRETVREQFEQGAKTLRNGLLHGRPSHGDTLRRALPFRHHTERSLCWHAVDIDPADQQATIENQGVQRVQLPASLRDTVSAALAEYRRKAYSWLIPSPSATPVEIGEMKRKFTELYAKAESAIAAAATNAFTGFLRADNNHDRVNTAWAFRAGDTTMRLMLSPSVFAKCVIRIAQSPQFSDVPVPMTGKVLTKIVEGAKIEGLGQLKNGIVPLDTMSVDAVHIDASPGAYRPELGARMLSDSLEQINTHRSEEELIQDYKSGMLDLFNFWMSPKHDAKPMCFLRHRQGADGNPVYSGPVCEPTCPRCLRGPPPDHNAELCSPTVSYNDQQQWVYFPQLSLDEGWAAAFPTATSCHSAFDGDWSDPYLEQRVSCELRALSLVVDMQDEKSVNRAAELLAQIPRGDAPESLAFACQREAAEFLKQKWQQVCDA